MSQIRLTCAILATLALGFLGAAAEPTAVQAGTPVVDKQDKKENGKGDKEKLQGTWEVETAEKGGEKLPEEVTKTFKATIKGDKLIVELLEMKMEGSYKIDPSKKPKHIDMTIDDKTIEGIYEFVGEKLKLAAGEPGQARPKDFTSEAGSMHIVVTLRRAKETKKDAQKKDAPQARPAQRGGGKAKTDAEGIQGAWTVEKAEKGGEAIPDEVRQTIKLTFKGEKLVLEMLGMTKDGSYKIDAGKKPKTIDLTMDDKTAEGIYVLEGDTLKICMTEPGTQRPGEFKSEAGSANILVILKRAKADKKDANNGKEDAECCEDEPAPRTAQAQDAARRESVNNLKQIGLAMHNYHDTYKSMPAQAIYSADGKKPLLSWRVAILPFIEQDALYKEFKLDEPWDSEHNKKLIEKMPKIYAPVLGDAKPGMTYYQVFNGPGAIFDGPMKTRLSGVTDGTSYTILAVEGGTAVPWTKPDDIPFDPKKDLPKLGGLFKEGFTAVFADGAVRFISRELDAVTLRALITRSGGEVIRDLNK